MYGRAVLWRRIPGWFRAWWLSAGRRPPREELRVATSQLVEALLSQGAQGDVGPWKRVVVTVDGQLVRPGDALAEAATASARTRRTPCRWVSRDPPLWTRCWTRSGRGFG